MRVDQAPIVEIWVYLSGSPLFALTLTLAVDVERKLTSF